MTNPESTQNDSVDFDPNVDYVKEVAEGGVDTLIPSELGTSQESDRSHLSEDIKEWQLQNHFKSLKKYGYNFLPEEIKNKIDALSPESYRNGDAAVLWDGVGQILQEYHQKEDEEIFKRGEIPSWITRHQQDIQQLKTFPLYNQLPEKIRLILNSPPEQFRKNKVGLHLSEAKEMVAKMIEKFAT